MAREGLLARTLVALADSLVDDYDVVDLMTLLADRCVSLLEVSAAGLMLVAPDGDLRVVASSSEEMRMLELFELQSAEGPCLDCYRSGEAVLNRDLSRARAAWPLFAAEARSAGFQMVHALPMRLRGDVIGALNLFHVEAASMPLADVDAAQALADIATIGVLQRGASRSAQTITDQLKYALEHRVVIEQAKGVVSEREKLAVEDAFLTIRRYARSHNRRLADVARDIVDGTLPPSELRRTGAKSSSGDPPAARS